MAPLHGDVTGALYSILGPVELSAAERLYMDPPALSRRLQVKKTRFGTDAVIYPASG